MNGAQGPQGGPMPPALSLPQSSLKRTNLTGSLVSLSSTSDADDAGKTPVTERKVSRSLSLNNLFSEESSASERLAERKTGSAPQPENTDNNIEQYWKSLSTESRSRFERNGITKAILQQKLGKCEQIEDTLDNLLNDAIDQPDSSLRHHLVPKGVLGSIFLLASSGERWLGLGGLTETFKNWHLPGGAASAMAVGVSFLAFMTSNMLSAYGINRTHFEGLFHWTDACTGLVALVPSVIDSIAAYVALTAGFGMPVAGAMVFAFIDLISNLPYYWSIVDRFYETLRGRDAVKEDELERAVWLLGKVLQEKEAGQDVDGKTLAQRVIATGNETVCQRMLRWTALYSPANKARNVIKNLKSKAASGDIKISVLEKDAVKHRLTGPSKWLGRGAFSSLMGLCAAYTFADNSATLNTFTNNFGWLQGCRTLAQKASYAGWQGIFSLASAGQTLSTAILSYDNMKDFARYMKRCARKGSQQAQLTTGRSEKVLDKTLFVFASAACLCFTLTTFGAIRTDLSEDICLSDINPLSYALPVLGCAGAFLHSANLGPEFKGVLLSVRDMFKPCTSWLRRTGQNNYQEGNPLLSVTNESEGESD